MVKTNLSLKTAAVLAATALLLVFATTAALDGPEANWHTIDGGGGASLTAGDLFLSGTIGQPDAGLLTGGDYALGGGFWGGGMLAAEYEIYLPLVLRGFASLTQEPGETR